MSADDTGTFEPASLQEWLGYIESIHPKDIDMGLERFSQVAGRLGVLRPAPRVVTVAGTNGKGSTAVALEALLISAGLKVGATLSPHISRFNERIRLNGTEVADEALCRAFAAADLARDEIPLTYFEYSALAALFLFKESDLDVAILEIGLGGRLDAFNAVDADLAIVTSIGLDHQDYLGNDLETIGREKAGVFREGQDVVLGNVTASVHDAAEVLDCRTYVLGQGIQVHRQNRGVLDEWHYRCADLDLELSHIPLGALAPDNCALALTAAALLTSSREVAMSVASLRQARLPGRMEQHDYQGADVILDVAHNPAAAAFLAEELAGRFPGRRYLAIYGALEGKDSVGVVNSLDHLVEKWLLISTHGSREQSADALGRKLNHPTEVFEDVQAALTRAVSLTGSGDGILVFGSFSAVEQARELLCEPDPATPPPGSAETAVAGKPSRDA